MLSDSDFRYNNRTAVGVDDRPYDAALRDTAERCPPALRVGLEGDAMANRPRSNKGTAKPRRDGAEYRFIIDAFSPKTIPMARLAEYMGHLAAIFGERSSVHFDRLEAGSTVLVSKIEREAVPKVKQRVVSVRRREGPSEGIRAYKAINRLLREDNSIGLLKEKPRGATIIRFPGREEAEEEFPAVRQYGSIDGVVVRIGGKDQTVHVTLESEDEQIAGCFTTRRIAKELAHKLFEPVRLHGRGRWNRDRDGRWTLLDFKIESFEPLVDVPLSQALAEIRAIKLDWGPGAMDELPAIRHGRSKNGGH